jgi:hypothetical protein
MSRTERQAFQNQFCLQTVKLLNVTVKPNLRQTSSRLNLYKTFRPSFVTVKCDRDMTSHRIQFAGHSFREHKGCYKIL